MDLYNIINRLSAFSLYIYILFFVFLAVKSIYFSSKIWPNIFLVFLIINVFFISIRLFLILSNKISFVAFFLTCFFFSSFFLLALFYLRVKKNKISTFFNFEIQFLKKVLLFLIEFNKIFDIFLLNNFRNLSFREWTNFFNSYLQRTSFEIIFLNLMLFFFVLTIITLSFDLTFFKLTYSVLFLFLFNLIFRISFAIFYLFRLYLRFAINFLLEKDFEINIDDFYFFSGKWLPLFINWQNRNSEQVSKTSKFTLYYLYWIDYTRLNLFLGKLSFIKTNLDIFLAILFILFFFKITFFKNPIFSLIWFDILSIYLILLFYKIIFFNINFFQDKPTVRYLRFLSIFNWWSKNNKYGFRFLILPLKPFFKSFLEKIRK